ncbi:ABC transporter permease [Tepidibacter thalassicus]|uniref:ABC-2 type transport system permease protein n=1 Tax=Tepidibacter thalassicus DSM 15285 TaxID=1123350 RepID=A0A1M5R8Y7_9FIRM|nr:ABC transporter permease [Tepidibacter thalassicus]SHH22628.1 ABC-2 type transport system permease protein [Tepidibacter thalassicus DSM 15285]
MRILKEIVKFFKDPKNIVILLLGPMLFTFLIGGVYLKDYINDIPIVVLDMDNTSTSRMVISQFENNERYCISYRVNSLNDLKSIIDSKKAYLGIYIPKGFNKDIKKQKSSNIALIVDESNITIGNTALASATEILATLNAGINIKILEAKGIDPNTSYNLAKIFNFESRVLYDPKFTYKGYLMPGIILVFVQQLFLSAFIPKILEDRENILIKSGVYATVAAISYVFCALILKHFLNINIRGSLLIAFVYVYLFVLSLLGIALVIASLFKDRLKVTQFTMLLSMPTFLTAGYAWPIEQIPKYLLYVIKVIWPLIYAISPIRDIIIKNTPIEIFKKEIISLVLFGIVWFIIGYNLFKYTFDKKNGGNFSEQEEIV